MASWLTSRLKAAEQLLQQVMRSSPPLEGVNWVVADFGVWISWR